MGQHVGLEQRVRGLSPSQVNAFFWEELITVNIDSSMSTK